MTASNVLVAILLSSLLVLATADWDQLFFVWGL
jgi:hypothetical protein